jgi:hypothetical protein
MDVVHGARVLVELDRVKPREAGAVRGSDTAKTLCAMTAAMCVALCERACMIAKLAG